MTPAPPSPRRGAAGRAGPGPAAAHPAPALCGWVAPPPPRPAPPPRLVSPAGGDLPGCRPPGGRGALCGLAPGERRGCANTGPSLPVPPPLPCPSRELSRREDEAIRGSRCARAQAGLERHLRSGAGVAAGAAQGRRLRCCTAERSTERRPHVAPRDSPMSHATSSLPLRRVALCSQPSHVSDVFVTNTN